MAGAKHTAVENSVVYHICPADSELSNLYECEIQIGRLTFPSASHAFHCLQKVDKRSYPDWCVGGKFTDWDYVLDKVNKRSLKPINKKYWKKKKLIGVLAEQAIKHRKTFNVRLKPRDDRLCVSKKRWFPILRAKFKGKLKKKLLETSGVLVSLDKKAKKRNSMWGGMVENGVLYGSNNMGNMLTSFRDYLKDKKRPRVDIEVVGHMSLDESINNRFKKARLEGRVVDLTK